MLLALLGALVIGLSLGLLGSGGSILTVPVLAFILQRPDKLAITESLAIVGSIALVGAIPYGVRRQIHWKSILFFGMSGMGGAYTGACFSHYISGKVQLIAFAFALFLASWMMLFCPKEAKTGPLLPPYSNWMTVVEGFFVGCLTGLMGIGGGFLIVPSLVLLIHLPMHLAIGTSLMIVAINSFTGFIEQMLTSDASEMPINWSMIIFFSSVGILSSFMGSFIAEKISQPYLRKIFGIGMIPMGFYILINRI